MELRATVNKLRDAIGTKGSSTGNFIIRHNGFRATMSLVTSSGHIGLESLLRNFAINSNKGPVLML